MMEENYKVDWNRGMSQIKAGPTAPRYLLVREDGTHILLYDSAPEELYKIGIGPKDRLYEVGQQVKLQLTVVPQGTVYRG